MGEMDRQTVRLPLHRMIQIYGDPKHPDFVVPGISSIEMNLNFKKDD